MASIDRYRPPPREGYQPPVITKQQDLPDRSERPSKSPTKRRDVPPPVPTPPTHSSSRTSPPRPHSRPTASSPARETPKTPLTMANQWYFTPSEILSSPSILDGLPPAEERLRRAKGVNFIFQAGILLELPQITLHVASIFFHRFYMRQSMVEEKHGVHHYNIAATALFLANKTEENCRKTKDIIIAVARIAQKNPKLQVDEQSKEYWRWRDSILMYEEIMLENLTFDLMVDNPHFKLYELLGQLNVIHNKTLRHAAWAFCNDSAISTLPLLMDSRNIAMAAIFFSSCFTGEHIDDIQGQKWWKSLDGNEEMMILAVDTTNAYYRENPLRKTENPFAGSPEFLLDNTRRKADGIVSSATVTPRTDHATQSPKARVNGVDESAAEREIDTATAESASQSAPGDSDAILKEAANNPTIHVDTNGDKLSSPSKRKEVESLASESREQKRQRLGSDDDEGEVHE